MNHMRRVQGIIVGLALAMLFIAPAAAQPSINAKLISDLNNKLMYAAVPITVLVEGILIYTIYRFKDSGEAKPTQENRRLEITWTVATAIILLFVGLASFQVLTSSFIGGATAVNHTNESVEGLSFNYSGAQVPAEENAVQVEVVARKYSWTFNYIEADGDVTTTGTLVIPSDRPVYIHVTSDDWIHSFHVQELGLKQDAIPGQYNTVKTKVFEPGSYRLYCAEYCGVGHSGMLGTIEVKSPESYQNWLDKQQKKSGSGSGQGSGNSSSNTSTGNSTNTSTGNSSSSALITPA
jgi:cytochrome c oxidase subunit 2